MKQVHVVVYTHRHGTSTTIGLDYEAAVRAGAGFAREWLDEQLGDKPQVKSEVEKLLEAGDTASLEAAIALFNEESREEEWISIETTSLEAQGTLYEVLDFETVEALARMALTTVGSGPLGDGDASLSCSQIEQAETAYAHCKAHFGWSDDEE